ncbi:MAG: hypothetical protein WC499_01375 [Patescibacteria group bacterium]
MPEKNRGFNPDTSQNKGIKSQNIELYDKEGRVQDPEIAQVMAKIEKPYREQKRWGVFGPSKKTIEKGEQLAEERGEESLEGRKDHLRREIIDTINYLLHKKGTERSISYTAKGVHQFGGPWSKMVQNTEHKLDLDIADGISINYTLIGGGFAPDGLLMNGHSLDIDRLSYDERKTLLKALKETAEPYKVSDRERSLKKENSRILSDEKVKGKQESEHKIAAEGESKVAELLKELAKKYKEKN